MPTCPVCADADPTTLLTLEAGVPVLANRLYDSAREARSATLGDTVIVVCSTCGHIWNAAFEASLVQYDEGYENSLHFSSVFSAFADELADSLVERFGLRGRTLVEIGSGQGDFLRELCRRGAGRGIGFDPSYSGAGDQQGEVTFVQSLFPSDAESLEADFVYARHVFEHLDDPRSVLAGVRQGLGGRECGLYVEVPDGGRLVDEPALWDLVYEHPSHFTASSLEWLVAESGFAVDTVATSFGGQFLYAEGSTLPSDLRPSGPSNDLLTTCGTFSARVTAEIARWQGLLGAARERGERVLVWGAGSKGTTFLNVVPGARESVPAIVDLNPRKHGRFVPGSGHEVVAPGAVAALGPDVVVVMNPLYTAEVESLLREHGVAATVVPVTEEMVQASRSPGR